MGTYYQVRGVNQPNNKPSLIPVIKIEGKRHVRPYQHSSITDAFDDGYLSRTFLHAELSPPVLPSRFIMNLTLPYEEGNSRKFRKGIATCAPC